MRNAGGVELRPYSSTDVAPQDRHEAWVNRDWPSLAPLYRTVPLEPFIERFWDHLRIARGLSRNTVLAYRRDIRRFQQLLFVIDLELHIRDRAQSLLQNWIVNRFLNLR